jgi:hypothetical protein
MGIEDRLRLPPRLDKFVFAQPREILRQRGLRKPDSMPQRRDRRLSLMQLQDHQPMAIGQGFEKTLRLFGLGS